MYRPLPSCTTSSSDFGQQNGSANGVLLDPEEGTLNAMRGIFGVDRLVACASKDLPKKLAAILEAIRGV
jgi:hypothetical protein